MQISPVSGDLLIKLGLIAAVGAGVYLMVNRVKGSATQGLVDFGAAVNRSWDRVGDAAQAVNPLNNDNAIYQGANQVFGTPSIGGAIYDYAHSDTRNPIYTGLGHLFGTDSIGSSLYDFFNPAPTPFFSGGGGNFAGNGASGGW